MKTWDLTAGAAKLAEAAKILRNSTAQVAESWTDQNHRLFQETYLGPMEPRLKNLLDATRRLAETLAGAERELTDR